MISQNVDYLRRRANEQHEKREKLKRAFAAADAVYQKQPTEENSQERELARKRFAAARESYDRARKKYDKVIAGLKEERHD